jgi:hypothetical protein
MFLIMINTILDIIHHPDFYLKAHFSYPGFCLRLQFGLAQMGPTESTEYLYEEQIN